MFLRWAEVEVHSFGEMVYRREKHTHTHTHTGKEVKIPKGTWVPHCLDFLPSDETIDGMVHSKSISDRSLGIVLWVNVFNVVDDGIQQMRLSHSASWDHCGHVGDVDMEVIYGFGG